MVFCLIISAFKGSLIFITHLTYLAHLPFDPFALSFESGAPVLELLRNGSIMIVRLRT